MTPACMTPDELRLWAEAARYVKDGSRSPCADCPLAFAAEMRAQGCCNGIPQLKGRPWGRVPSLPMTDAERIARRQKTWRESKRRAAARAKCDNGVAGSSSQSHRLPDDARVSATTRGAGVVLPVEVVAR